MTPTTQHATCPEHLTDEEKRVWRYNDTNHPEDNAIRAALDELSRTRDALTRAMNGVVREGLGYTTSTPMNVEYVIDLVKARVGDAESDLARARAALSRASLWLSAHASASRFNGVTLRDEILYAMGESTTTSLSESSDVPSTGRED